jgi:hypothetical protein
MLTLGGNGRTVDANGRKTMESPFWSAVGRACARVHNGETVVYVIAVPTTAGTDYLALSAGIAEAIASAHDGTLLVRVGR